MSFWLIPCTVDHRQRQDLCVCDPPAQHLRAVVPRCGAACIHGEMAAVGFSIGAYVTRTWLMVTIGVRDNEERNSLQ